MPTNSINILLLILNSLLLSFKLKDIKLCQTDFSKIYQPAWKQNGS